MKTKSRKRAALLLLYVAMGSPGIASAQEQASQAIQNRVATFREMGTASKHIKDQLALKQPDLQLIRDSASLIQERGAYMLDWFPRGSEPPPPKSWWQALLDWFSSDEGVSVVADDAESHARPAVWTQWPQFQAAFRKFEVQAGQMRNTAQQGPFSAIGLQFAKLQRTCKDCHDVFRGELD